MSLQKLVDEFHQKFGLDYNGPPRFLPPELEVFRLKFLKEELQEYEDAVNASDMTKAFDALLDLLYVVHGTLHLHGFPTDKGFQAVHHANMSKVKAARVEDSKRGSLFDVVKPSGWIKPDDELARILGEAFVTSNGRP